MVPLFISQSNAIKYSDLHLILNKLISDWVLWRLDNYSWKNNNDVFYFGEDMANGVDFCAVVRMLSQTFMRLEREWYVVVICSSSLMQSVTITWIRENSCDHFNINHLWKCFSCVYVHLEVIQEYSLADWTDDMDTLGWEVI